MHNRLTAHTIVPLEDSLPGEPGSLDPTEAPAPPPRTPVPPQRILDFPAPAAARPPEGPLEAPDAVVVYLRRAGLVDEHEQVEVVTDAPPPVRSRSR